MNSDFAAAMRQAVQLTRQRNLMEATRVIQRALSGRGRAAPAADPSPEGARLIAPPNASEAPAGAEPPRRNARMESALAGNIAEQERPSGRVRRPLGEALNLLRQVDRSGVGPRSAPLARLRKAPPVPVPEGAAWLTRSFACEAGSRDYKVYVPSRVDGRALPLVVMLHGCTQNPDDFAVGTCMNRLAEDLGFIVAYPRQPTTANPSACWNWFSLADQRRGEGEPSILAGITRAIMAEFRIDAERVYVAGLSAGGAMAAIMGAAYPELYAATGIHSGLAYGSATDVVSAFAAMRGGSSPIQTTPLQAPRPRRPKGANGRVRTIVFHGASDKTVDPSNAEAILADASAGLSESAYETQQDGIAGGRAYTRTVITDANGAPHAECWEIEGLGHAWSGGSPEGSYTDPRGPDASREMLRFFLATPTQPPAL
jgi:poly(hydroxyalkanoate) depolymerase family esterase